MSYEIVTPEIVDGVPSKQVESEPQWPDAACPTCGATARQCPENFGPVASIPDWTQDRCYRCGRRSEDSLSQEETMRKMWAQFTEWYQSDAGAGKDLAHPTVSTENREVTAGGASLADELEALKAEVENMKNNVASPVQDPKLSGGDS